MKLDLITMFTLYSLTSELHQETPAQLRSEEFIQEIESALGEHFICKGADFSTYAETENNIIYVRTGGTEGLFKNAFCQNGVTVIPDGKPVRLLTSGRSNSLAASMEILSFLNRAGLPGEIIHGSTEQIVAQLRDNISSMGKCHIRSYNFGKVLQEKRLGVVGRPSDWLISSDADYRLAKEKLGVEIIDIDIDELIELVKRPEHWDEMCVQATGEIGTAARSAHAFMRTIGENESLEQLREVLDILPMNEPKFGRHISDADFRKSLTIYYALAAIITKYGLDGITLRCFDLLTALGSTGCVALAILNRQGIVATCEGDVPTLLTMCVARELFGTSGFQANLSRIDGSKLLFAHCTVPLDLVEDYCYDTHFESGIGVAVHGVLPPGPAKIFKVSPNCSEMLLEDVNIIENQYNDCLCRTQVCVDAPGLSDYFLRSPIGNHHVIIPSKKQC